MRTVPRPGVHRPAPRPRRSGGVFYGWIIAALAGLGVYLSGPGQTYSVSTFIDHFLVEFGWSRSLVSTLYSAGTLTAGLLMTVVGRVVDVRGYRVTFTGVVLLFAGALAFMSTVSAPAALFIGFLLIRTFGQGSMTLIPYSLVPQWFVTRRGRALSLLAIGSALGAATIPHVNLFIIRVAGWRPAWLFWAGVMALLMAPLVWLLTRDRPEDMGLLPDGDRPVEDGSSPVTPDEDAWTPAEAVRTATFWTLLLATSVPSMLITGAQFHHMSIMADNGLTPAAAASVFTVTASVHLLVTPLAGVVCDRLPIRRVLSATLAAGALHLLLVLTARSLPMALLLGAVHGTKVAFLNVAGGLTWPHYFGRRYLASIRGMTTAGMVIGSALGPLPFGVARDLFGSYQQVLLASMVLPVVAGLAVLRLNPPARARASDRHAAGT